MTLIASLDNQQRSQRVCDCGHCALMRGAADAVRSVGTDSRWARVYAAVVGPYLSGGCRASRDHDHADARVALAPTRPAPQRTVGRPTAKRNTDTLTGR